MRYLILSTVADQKQNDYLELYYADDLSLGEVADEFQVSRQAVYDNLKRSTQLLENYEAKLHLYADFQNGKRLLKICKAILQKIIQPMLIYKHWQIN
ncbi:putative DNA-binding protein [Weissella viridescens]|uniref:Putative DNA-binding protein n=1 Tax=Weissella viridescens TaxID=1629 RepID=A0A380P7H2_WEIVI|nr:putative DNA-binding protein [Weissella viridescens]